MFAVVVCVGGSSDLCCYHLLIFFFFNDTATTEIYTLSLHDALPISDKALPSLIMKIVDLSEDIIDVEREIKQLSEPIYFGSSLKNYGYVINKAQQRGIENLRDELEEVADKLNQATQRVNDYLIQNGFYIDVNLDLNFGDGRRHLYMKSYQIKGIHDYLVSSRKEPIKIYRLAGIDNIVSTNIMGYHKKGRDFAVVSSDTIRAEFKDIKEILNQKKSYIYRDIEGQLTKSGKKAVNILRDIHFFFLKEDFSKLSDRQIIEAITNVVKIHEFRHVLDSKTIDNHIDKETAAFLAELISGGYIYYSLSQWSAKLFTGGAHDYAARKVFASLVNKAREKDYTDFSIDFSYASFMNVVETLHVFMKINDKEKVKELARDIFKDMFNVTYEEPQAANSPVEGRIEVTRLELTGSGFYSKVEAKLQPDNSSSPAEADSPVEIGRAHV